MTRVKDLLRLDPKGQQCTSINTFGSMKRLDQSCEIVQIGMKLRDGSDLILELHVYLRSPQFVSHSPVNRLHFAPKGMDTSHSST